MKIRIASDLHLEFLMREWPDERLINPAQVRADVLVLAGDIHNGAEAMRVFGANWPDRDNTSVIYVAGNHEYYHRDLPLMQKAIRQDAELNRVHFLENNRVDIKGVRFLGCTLWTDYMLFTDHDHTQKEQMHEASRALNDHRLIRNGSKGFTVQEALRVHLASRQWLDEELDKTFDGKTVVVTHHGPHPNSVHPRYKAELLSAAFCSNMEDLVVKADLWIHGHVHDGFDYVVGKCRVIANPAGYMRERHNWHPEVPAKFENATFNPKLVIEI